MDTNFAYLQTDFELPIDDDLAQEDLDDLEFDEALLREVEENDVRRDIERENIKAAQIAAAQKLKDENNAQVQSMIETKTILK